MRSTIFTIALVVLLFSSPSPARIKEPSADFCALLPVNHLEKVFEQPFGPVEKSTPPPSTSNVSSATECDYNSQKRGQRKIVFIVYEDTSTTAAKENFNRFMTMFGTTGLVDGVGELAYTDSNQAIHVLSGKIRYYISISPSASNNQKVQQQLKGLANWVAEHLSPPAP